MGVSEWEVEVHSFDEAEYWGERQDAEGGAERQEKSGVGEEGSKRDCCKTSSH